jgi:chemotaxis protein MotB
VLALISAIGLFAQRGSATWEWLGSLVDRMLGPAAVEPIAGETPEKLTAQSGKSLDDTSAPLRRQSHVVDHIQSAASVGARGMDPDVLPKKATNGIFQSNQSASVASAPARSLGEQATEAFESDASARSQSASIPAYAEAGTPSRQNLTYPPSAVSRVTGPAAEAGTSSANVSDRRQGTDFSMQELEAELRALSIAVERMNGERLLIDLGDKVRFAGGSATLGTEAQDFLEQLAGSIKKSLPVNIRVIGHTDRRGRAVFNAWLSEQRAEVVAKFLASKGIPEEYLSHEGKGETEPKVDSAQEWTLGLSANRRIEMELSKPAAANEGSVPTRQGSAKHAAGTFAVGVGVGP